MSQQKGLLVTCHRCGETVFLKYKGSGHFDGGYTTTDEFEDKPEGWTHEYPEESGKGWADLCPSCTDKFLKTLHNFYDLGG